jgi:ABC-2 type transport system permease protein
MIRINTFFVIPVEIFLLIYYGIKVNLSTMAWCLMPIMIVLSLILLALTGILQSSFMFWIYQGSGINYLRLQFSNISCWPDQVFSKPFRDVFTYIFPILVIGSQPVKLLLNPNKLNPLLIIFMEIFIFTIITKVVWKKALSHYGSASS